MSIFTKTFALATLERAVKTVCQSAAALLLADGAGLLTVDWAAVGSVSGLAGVISVLTSIGSTAVGEPGPSLTTESTALAEVDAEYVGEHRSPAAPPLTDPTKET